MFLKAYSSSNRYFSYFLIGYLALYLIVKLLLVVSPSFKVFFNTKFGRFKHLFNEKDDDDEYNTQGNYTYETPVISNTNYFVYDGNNLGLMRFEISNILEKNFYYYRNLQDEHKTRFFERLERFMMNKQFIIHSHEPFKEMPVLISAAAVQISFGLDDFELDHYDYIQIHKEEYFAHNSLRVLAGNVQGNCITLAWNQFLKGNADYTDGSNVGLHELAHALYFQEIIVDKDNTHFENYFNELMYRGESVIQQKKCPHNLYTDYAFSSLQEFWAVSVELFFEKTAHLQINYPHVFETLQNILKQNPVNTQNPIIK